MTPTSPAVCETKLSGSWPQNLGTAVTGSVRPVRVLMLTWDFPPHDRRRGRPRRRARPGPRAGRPRRRGAHRRASPGLRRPEQPTPTCACCGPTSTCRGSPTTTSSPARRRRTTTSSSLSSTFGDWRPRSCTPTAGVSPGRRRRWRRSTARRSSPRSTTRRAVSTAAACRRGPRHDPRRRVVARPPLQPGAGGVAVHGARGALGVRGQPRQGAPHPQRHRPDVVGDRRAAATPGRRWCSRGAACSSRRGSRSWPGR